MGMGKKKVYVYSDQRTRAESQRIVETSLLCPLQYPVLYISRLQRILSLPARSEIAIQHARAGEASVTRPHQAPHAWFCGARCLPAQGADTYCCSPRVAAGHDKGIIVTLARILA